jgi:predicted phosphate transport protein (TIGR00153 family)
LQIIPRDAQFYDLFAQVASRLSGSATLLNELFKDPAKVEQHVAAIKTLEHEADNLTHDTIDRIDRTFVTPFDREDIHALAGHLDEVVDLIDGCARRASIFHIKESKKHGVILSDVLLRATQCIEDTVKKMKDPKVVSSANRQLKMLEEEGDAMYHEAVEILFSTTTDAIEVMKWKELYDKIEDAIDQCEDVGNTLQSIALKNS